MRILVRAILLCTAIGCANAASAQSRDRPITAADCNRIAADLLLHKEGIFHSDRETNRKAGISYISAGYSREFGPVNVAACLVALNVIRAPADLALPDLRRGASPQDTERLERLARRLAEALRASSRN